MPDWRPDARTSSQDRQQLAARIGRAVRLLIELAGLPPSAAVDRLSDLTFRNAPALLNPEVFRWYNLMLPAVDAGDAPGQRRLHELLPQVEEHVRSARARAVANVAVVGAEVDLATDEAAAATSFQRLRDTTTLLPDGVGVHQVPADEVVVRRLRSGYQAVARLWPEVYEDIQDFVQKIVLFDEERQGGLEGFTDFHNHGAIFVRSRLIRDAETDLAVAEQLVHEAAHARLNTFLATHTLLLNDPGELYASPLRTDPRPLLGVFQQLYVLSRLTELYRRASAEDARWTATLTRTRDDLAEALRIVQAHARLSPEGAQLVDSIAALSGRSASPA